MSSEVIRIPQRDNGGKDAEAIAWLAALNPLEYDRIRKAEAQKLGVQVKVLDREVYQARKGSETGSIDFNEPDPWHDPVDGAKLLSEITAIVHRFIVCDESTAQAVALWVAMTWFIDVVQVAPLAAITAPEKRCGKSQLLALIGKLARRPLTASNISPSALFRTIDAFKPTLLIDEADAFMRDNEEIRGILNCGHTRDSAFTVRLVGEDHVPTRFNVWGAKAIAGIGHLADTLMDRAIVLELRRKLANEKTDRLRYAEADLFSNLASKLAKFAEDNSDLVGKARPHLPESLHDRAQDNWEPLLAIAEIAGGNWPDLARKAALKISCSESVNPTLGAELLADIREIFEMKATERISTKSLIESLVKDDEKTWATSNRGQHITPRQVARLLKGYGIVSKTIRLSFDTPKGYELGQFREAFMRYLDNTPEISATTPQA